ncbi:hypothetical protein G1H11_11640 [Phytoactinopolyspora alkaliphila]|uniref:Uncharacterized protein n=1 Tax=Phytoactinopolyspora alkaliphila TaxID=1783498 RepID=A0A6N9YLX9_9ACTN|nr:hypothetical protein [Phytoactinopolyspora alkaliphila]NED95962.1 hypothetical protein [Phytoactinopolyspora alkaliphila]
MDKANTYSKIEPMWLLLNHVVLVLSETWARSVVNLVCDKQDDHHQGEEGAKDDHDRDEEPWTGGLAGALLMAMITVRHAEAGTRVEVFVNAPCLTCGAALAFRYGPPDEEGSKFCAEAGTSTRVR